MPESLDQEGAPMARIVQLNRSSHAVRCRDTMQEATGDNGIVGYLEGHPLASSRVSSFRREFAQRAGKLTPDDGKSEGRRDSRSCHFMAHCGVDKTVSVNKGRRWTMSDGWVPHRDLETWET